MYKQNKLSEYQICQIYRKNNNRNESNQFHLEPDITPLDSRGEESKTNPKLNYTDSMYIFVCDKGQM